MVQPSRPQRAGQWLVAACVFVLALGLASIYIRDAERKAQVDERARASDLTADHAQALQRDIERALSATYALAALVRQGQGAVPDFEAVASEMLAFYPGIAALGLAPGGVVRQAVPLAGNEKVLGFDMLRDGPQSQEAIKARDTGRLTLAGPLELRQGGLGAVGRFPVFLNGGNARSVFWGFTFVTLRFPQALEAARLSLLSEQGYAYTLWRVSPETGQRLTIARSTATLLNSPEERSLELPNGQWTLSVAPVQGWGASDRFVLQGVIGLLASVLLAHLAWLLYGLKQRDAALEALVDARTAEIQASQEQLKATVGAIPDPLFELDLEGRYFSVYTPSAALLVAPAGELLGKTVAEVLPPLASETVLAALQEAYENNSSSGRQYMLPLADGAHWFELSIARKAAPAGSAPRFVVLSRDITQSRRAAERIQLLAHYDPLTGLPNRALLADRGHLAVSTAQRNGTPLALMFLDLDHFKNVNDSLGHRVGDELLAMLATRLSAVVREQDTVSRMGGDEFILVLPETDAQGAARVAEKMLHSVAQPFVLGPHELTVTPSVGIALYPNDGEDFDTLARSADAAMYRAKHEGRNNFRFYTAELQARSDRALLLENALRRALEREQLSLHYQPQVALDTGQVIGAEALLRWQHPELGAVSPAEFIPVAEASGLILTIGEWVLRTAVGQLATWMADGMAPITMSVNLSSVQFRLVDLPQRVSALLQEAGLPAHLLELELTEGVALTDPLGAIAMMDKLHQLGVRMSIDDFGTGYSSLNYLKKFRVYKVKIDQSFVRDITEDADDRAIVGAIISLANSLGLKTIAEGVETPAQLAFLQEKGCDEVQGYYYSKPLPHAQFEAFFKAHAAHTAPL